MIAWFRVDASIHMGAGHLMRCLALAEALSEQHVECKFLVRAPTIPFCKERLEWRWQLIDIPQQVEQESEMCWLQQNCDISGDDILLLDGYQFDADYINALQVLNVPVVLFDDNNDRGHITAQLVINGAANAEQLNYQGTMPKAMHCLGNKYRLLRAEFRTELPQPMHLRHSIAIIMGGSDSKGLIIPLLNELQHQQSEAPVRVLINNNYPHGEELQTTINKCDFAVQLVVNGPDLANIFSHSKLVISAAGGTQFELLAMHTPAVLLMVAENQVNATQQSQLQGWCETFDCLDRVPVSEVVSRTRELLEQPEALALMHKNAAKHADNHGTERLLDAILELSVD